MTVDQIILWINLVLGISFLMMSLVNSVWVIVAMFVIIQGLLNAERPVVSDYVNQRVESHQRSTMLSAISFVRNFGEIFARLGLGLSVGLIGVSSTFIVQGTYLVIGAWISWWYLRRCGCVHKVRPSDDTVDELAAAEVVL